MTRYIAAAAAVLCALAGPAMAKAHRHQVVLYVSWSKSSTTPASVSVDDGSVTVNERPDPVPVATGPVVYPGGTLTLYDDCHEPAKGAAPFALKAAKLSITAGTKTVDAPYMPGCNKSLCLLDGTTGVYYGFGTIDREEKCPKPRETHPAIQKCLWYQECDEIEGLILEDDEPVDEKSWSE